MLLSSSLHVGRMDSAMLVVLNELYMVSLALRHMHSLAWLLVCAALASFLLCLQLLWRCLPILPGVAPTLHLSWTGLASSTARDS